MRGKKTDTSIKTQIIEEKLKDPGLSSRDIANKIWWVSNDTVCDIINKDLPQVATQSEVISKMIDDNNKILNLTWKLLLEKLENWEKVRIDEVIKSRDLALKQNKLVEVIENKEWEFIVKFEI